MPDNTTTVKMNTHQYVPCAKALNNYQVKRHEESIKHQNKVKGKEQPTVIRNGEDDETGIMGI